MIIRSRCPDFHSDRLLGEVQLFGDFGHIDLDAVLVHFVALVGSGVGADVAGGVTIVRTHFVFESIGEIAECGCVDCKDCVVGEGKILVLPVCVPPLS
jgi:hypothetical protein